MDITKLTNARIQELINELKVIEDELHNLGENPNTSPMWSTVAIRKAQLTSLLGGRYEQKESKKPRGRRKTG